MTEIYVKVVPGEDEFRIEKGEIPKIHLESEAEKGRANNELVRRLEEMLGEKPGIVSGHRSRRKKLVIDMEKKEVMGRLEEDG